MSRFTQTVQRKAMDPRSAALAVLLLGCVTGIARAGLHEVHPTSYPPLPRASASVRAARSLRSTEKAAGQAAGLPDVELAVLTTPSGEFESGLAKVDGMDACFVDMASEPPADPENGRRKTFDRHLCQVHPLNHSFDTFVVHCDPDDISDLQDKREDFDGRVGTVSVTAGVDGPRLVDYVPRFGDELKSRDRRDYSGTQHCIQPRDTPGVTPPGNSCMTRNVLMIRVTFLDSMDNCDEACIRATMWMPAGASDFQYANEAFKASSYGQTEFDEASSDVITVSVNENVGAYSSNCPVGEIADVAEALATAAGYTPGEYHHTVFFIPLDFGSTCGWGGLAQRPGSRVWMRVTYGRWYFLEHEIGHNLGLSHAGTDNDDDGFSESTYGDNMGVMGDGWTFNGPSRMSLGWIVDGVGHVRYNPTPTCTRARISAFDHRPSDSTYTNPHGHTMVSFPRSSESDRYYVTFYASRDLYGTTLQHSDWLNQVHIQAFGATRLSRHVAKLTANEAFTATGTTGGDIVFTVVSIGSDTAEVEIRRSGEPECGTSAPSLGTTTPAPSQPGTPTGDLTCGETFTGSTVGAPGYLNRNSGGHLFALEVASDGTTITVSACGSQYDTVLRVYTGSDIFTIESDDIVKSNDDGCGEGSVSSQLTHTFLAGSYTVILDGYDYPNDVSEGLYTITTDSTCASVPTPAPTARGYCPEGYDDLGTRYNWPLGRITVVRTHQQCSERCTQYSAPQFNGGCKGYMTGMYFGFLYCRSYGGNLRTTRCAPWAVPTNPGYASGEIGSVHPRTGQENVGGNCCTNTTLSPT